MDLPSNFECAISADGLLPFRKMTVTMRSGSESIPLSAHTPSHGNFGGTAICLQIESITIT
jgi:hypothetical protein